MAEPIPESEHVQKVLREARKALRSGNALRLKRLSDQTIHSASVYQHTDYIVIAIIIYTLSKLVFRKEHIKRDRWEKFVKNCSDSLRRASNALHKHNHPMFISEIEHARESLSTISGDLKPFIEAVFQKASVSKATKIYEHGISLGQTAELLGLSTWELAEYIGERNIADAKYSLTKDVRIRAQHALEFFST